MLGTYQPLCKLTCCNLALSFLQGKSTQQFWELYELFNIKDWRLDGVYLPALVRQIPKMLGLFFVVTFGSCLDVAAIQADMPFPIDFNSELGTVGLSNVIVGLSGACQLDLCKQLGILADTSWKQHLS
jgi:MFS superfamily sulfate permease-like transporter